MKRIFLWLGLVFSFGNVDASFVYPIQTMSKLECRFQDFSTLGDNCKMQLPILQTKDYTKYKNDYSLYRRVYTILWGATYDYGWDVGNGGHGGVDIASAKGTPVYSITDGKVVFAGFLAGRGNTVKIQHKVNNRTVYSNYSHLSKIDVSLGNEVKTSTKIGEVGNTGNSFGNHLHFQLDLSASGKGPWYRSNCREKNYNTIVNSNVCFDQLNTHTIDPLLFLETSGAVVKAQSVVKPETPVISKEGLLSRKEILKREIDEFLRLYEVKIEILSLGGNVDLGKASTLRIRVIDKKTKRPFTGSFPGDMNFKFDNKKINIFPTGILQIDGGKRDFQVTPKLEGKMSFEVYMGETFFKKISLGVINPKKNMTPTKFRFSGESKSVIGGNSKGIGFFQDNFGLNILGYPFGGKVKLSSPDNSISFCLKKGNAIKELQYLHNIQCEGNFYESIEFSYADTISGVIVFDYKVKNIGKNTLVVSHNGKNIFTKNLLGVEPLGLKVSDPYYDDIIKTAKLGIVSGMQRGYYLPEKELSSFDAYFMIQALLEYKQKLCTTSECSQFYTDKQKMFQAIKGDKYKSLTREEFFILVSENFIIPTYQENDFYVFRDISSSLQLNAKNIFKNQTWNDYFGKTRYFQPNKKITRGEGAFILSLFLP